MFPRAVDIDLPYCRLGNVVRCVCPVLGLAFFSEASISR